MDRKKRYNEEFVAWIERTCQESGGVNSVDDQYYENFVALTNKQIVPLVMLILRETHRVFHKRLVSGVWKSDDEMYESLMPYLELIAEGKLAFDDETGKMLFFKPMGDPPSDEMWNRIQKRITSSRSAIRVAIARIALGRGLD
jgi:cbb3-type cytochrome oxidase cytochrome c subunit